MNKEIEGLINDLDRRFGLIEKIKAEELDAPLFYGSIQDYMEGIEKAIHISPLFHVFDHAEHDRFEEEVCQKIMQDESIPETERNSRVTAMVDFYFAPMCDMLNDIGNRIRKQQGNEEIHFAREMNAKKYREYLQRVHPTIIAILEKELTSEAPTDQAELKTTNPFLGIYYNSITGIGWSNCKKFKFKDQKPNFILFGKLFERIGNRVAKEEIWDIIGHEGNMIAINDVAGELREKTGLNTDELVLNNGNLTLALKKLESPPPIP
jgi:hypothetical protein